MEQNSFCAYLREFSRPLSPPYIRGTPIALVDPARRVVDEQQPVEGRES
jgi:hypothetical protein